MPRLIAVIVAVLALLGAGWWGWSNPDLLPERLRAHLPGAATGVVATRPPPRPRHRLPRSGPPPRKPGPDSPPGIRRLSGELVHEADAELPCFQSVNQA